MVQEILTMSLNPNRATEVATRLTSLNSDALSQLDARLPDTKDKSALLVPALSHKTPTVVV